MFEQASIEAKTFSYKAVDDIEIKADLYRLRDSAGLKPVIIWIHGGGLIAGSRKDIPQEQIEYYLHHGYSILSVDYRMAPATPLVEIQHDIFDAVAWTRKNGVDLQIDAEKVYLIGHSSGAYLSILAGHTMEKAPNAIISFYGYGDILDDWANAPNAHYLQLERIEEGRVLKGLDQMVITNVPFKERYDFYVYARQSGNWANIITHLNPGDHFAELEALCPTRNMHQNFPPTLLIHGDKDPDVPLSQSRKLSDALEKNGVAFELIEMQGFGHMFDAYEGGLSNAIIQKTFERVVHFLRKHA